MAAYASLDLAQTHTRKSKKGGNSKADAIEVDDDEDEDEDADAEGDEWERMRPIDELIAVVRAPEWRFTDVRLM